MRKLAKMMLAFFIGAIAAPFLPFVLAFVVWEDDDL